MENDIIEDIIQVEDEGGNELSLKLNQYFYVNGEEYVLFENTEDSKEQYIARVIISEVDGEEYEDFDFLEQEEAEAIFPIFLNRVDEIEFDE
ncbi:MAG: hypothetical protein ACOX54_01365 [Christensenellales bacterium]|jgi:hypothetical protein